MLPRPTVPIPTTTTVPPSIDQIITAATAIKVAYKAVQALQTHETISPEESNLILAARTIKSDVIKQLMTMTNMNPDQAVEKDFSYICVYQTVLRLITMNASPLVTNVIDIDFNVTYESYVYTITQFVNSWKKKNQEGLVVLTWNLPGTKFTVADVDNLHPQFVSLIDQTDIAFFQELGSQAAADKLVQRFPVKQCHVQNFEGNDYGVIAVRTAVIVESTCQRFGGLTAPFILKHTLLNVHLSHTTEQNRDRDKKDLVKWINNAQTPFIIAGDFNFRSHSNDTISHFLGQCVNKVDYDQCSKSTTSSSLYTPPKDYILFSEDLVCEYSGLLYIRAKKESNHFPKIALLKKRPPVEDQMKNLKLDTQKTNETVL